MGSETATGLVLFLRLIFLLTAIFVLVGFIGTDISTLLSLSAIFGTALGLAFSQALGNIVSGLYVLAARPFRVGDYVRIGNIEGVVNEITLNYTRVLQADETRQLVPNSKVLSSEVTNFRIQLADYIKEKEEEADQEGDRSIKKSIRSMLRELKTLTGYDDAYRYTFDFSVHMSFNQKEVQKLFDEVCEKWSKIFLAKPTYFVWAKPSAAITYRFAFITEDPMVIIKRGSDFLMDLLQVYHNPP